MRKMLLCALAGFGFMNFSYGQTKLADETLSIQSIDNQGKVEYLSLEGREALAFDIPSFIEDNSHLSRIVLNGHIKSDVSRTQIKFDSDKQADQDGEYLCQDITSTYKPFIGVLSKGRDDLNGVDLEKIVDDAPADRAGITTKETILEYNSNVINSYCDLTHAVRESSIGDKVELRLSNSYREYSKYITVGAHETKTITYRYCEEEPLDNDIEANASKGDVSLTVYPNPTRNMSYLNYTSGSDEDVIFSVMDIRGNLIHKEVFNSYAGNLRLEYNLENQSDGTYILAVQQGEEFHTSKVQLIK
jgi:hypothetical protein